MPLLAPRVRVVAYDRAGIGGSDPAPDPAIVARQVSDLASLITDRPSVVADAIMQVVARVQDRPDLSAFRI